MDPASLHAQTSEQAPRFSVVVPAYNAEATIALTMQSVLSQSCGDFELLVVDDGSTDRTLEVVGELAEKDPRVRVLSKPNGGCAPARNFGARAARGKFLGLLDSDDSYLSGYLETQDDAIRRHPEADIFSCNGIRRFGNARSLSPR
jgi:glycosyltransferase involved in cell wall biosynthesis